MTLTEGKPRPGTQDQGGIERETGQHTQGKGGP